MIKLKHFFFSHINIDKEVITFGGTEIRKQANAIKAFILNDADFHNIFICKTISSSEKN